MNGGAGRLNWSDIRGSIGTTVLKQSPTGYLKGQKLPPAIHGVRPPRQRDGFVLRPALDTASSGNSVTASIVALERHPRDGSGRSPTWDGRS